MSCSSGPCASNFPGKRLARNDSRFQVQILEKLDIGRSKHHHNPGAHRSARHGVASAGRPLSSPSRPNNSLPTRHRHQSATTGVRSPPIITLPKQRPKPATRSAGPVATSTSTRGRHQRAEPSPVLSAAAMSTPRRRLATASPSLRFLGLLKQPDDASSHGVVQELELDERDVVWSSSATSSSSSTSAASSPSPTPSPSASLGRPISASSRHFPAGGMGLSALLADADDHHAPTAPVPAAARPERQRAPQPCHQSAPVAVPAWPNAMTAADRRRREAELQAADDEDDDGEPVVPPHEMAARRAAAAASVMEGAGRTLKGRDLRRVRNAVWRTTGFLDL